MKKASAIWVLALATATATNAQDQSFRLGLEACPNFGWISSDSKSIENDGTRLGFRFGLLSDFRLGKVNNYWFSTGAFLNNVGAKTKFTSGEGAAATTVNGEVKLQYVEIPVTIKLKTAEIGYISYFGQIGFDAGLRVMAKSKAADGDFEDFSDNANIMRMSLSVGGGLEYNFSGNTSALIGLRYSNGFTNVNDDDGPDARLHYLEITVGALF